ncbi:efflux RND transporter periplasmic adaptor subunit [Alkalicaulis satelles]|uniref:Efflux RND transporter periplasmic adaptor subunit n=1 Tax=Alkalicaulis satelles TaxID=2609175 RepID=A0A5M6ZNI7_9PROT|nr:efflux RND transporter periplasmic adaptor subunit [Alkalicaulis satelles]
MVLAACGGAAPDSQDASGAGESFRHPAAAAEITRRDLSRQFSASARVEAYAHSRLAARTAGTVAEVLAEAGDLVEAGAVLARLDMREQRAELARTEARRAQAQSNYQRSATLHERGLLAAEAYERARADRDVLAREADLWRTRIAFGEITAPMDAMITARHIEVGEGVQALDGLFELTRTDLLVVRLGVSELDVAFLETGQDIPVHLDALPGAPLPATVRRIFPLADPSSRLVTVELALPEDSWARGARPGFLARVRLAIDPRPDVLAAPAAGIAQDNGADYVFVIADNRLEQRVIERGVTRGDWTEIISGLEEGEVVLATNPAELAEGQSVRIVGWRG